MKKVIDINDGIQYSIFNERKHSRFSAEAVPASIPYLKKSEHPQGVLFSLHLFYRGIDNQGMEFEDRKTVSGIIK